MPGAFSTAFSSAFDVGSEVPGMVDICYPAGTDWSCFGTPAEILELDPTIKARSEALAWSMLSALTAFRVSLCPVTIRPCAQRCGHRTWDVAPVMDAWGNASGYGGFSPYISGGSWFNACGCSSPRDCSCSSISEVLLPAEAGRIVSVILDGAVLDSTAYRVDNGNRLVRQDGGTWPSCQNMSEPETGIESVFAVTYYPGIAPNDLLRYAAGLLAAEFYKSCSGGDCRLPTGVTNIARAGVTYTMEGVSFPGGMSGIPEVDAVIRIYNPMGLKGPSRVLSPDRPIGRTKTWSV
jgi:hypothetical protein